MSNIVSSYGSQIIEQRVPDFNGQGPDAQTITRASIKKMIDEIFSVTSNENLQFRFERLYREWKNDTKFMSSASDKAMHPAYQQVIGMGKEALPLIFNKLKKSPDHWFWALQSITGVNPIPLDKRGNVPEMAKIWVSWGQEQGYC